MKQSTLLDLEDVQQAVENLKDRLSKMKLEELIDVAARLKAVAKNCEVIDETCKGEVKKKLGQTPGEVPGEVFKAVMRIDTPSRLDQTALKMLYPKIAAKLTKESPTRVITFEAR
jgi:uncharacterized protein with HEPN domain